MNNILRITSLSLAFLGFFSYAHAEGSKNFGDAWGANRVTRTESGGNINGNGVLGVKGHFSTPEYRLPILYLIDRKTGQLNPNFPALDYSLYNSPSYNISSLGQYFQDIRADGIRTQRAAFKKGSNINDDKPTFYLGSAASINGAENVVDAGVQYEWLPLNGAQPGWAPIFSNNGVFDDIKPGSILRIVLGASGLDIEHYVSSASGSAFLIITTPGSTISRAYAGGSRVYSNQEIAELSMKRVQGITQKNGAVGHLDGAYMRQSTFSVGKLMRADTGIYTNWTWEDTENDISGYKPDGLDQGTPSDPARYIIDFPELTTVGTTAGVKTIRADIHNSYVIDAMGDPSLPASVLTAMENRYLEEQVDINLRNGNKVTFHGLHATVGGAATIQ